MSALPVTGPIMVQSFVFIIAGLALLGAGADRFVLGASVTARRLGVPPLLIGLTVVALGTSAPEMLVSGTAAWRGAPALAVGNVLGSNIANVGLVIGATALVIPLAINSGTLRREYPVMMAGIVLAGVLMADGHLGRGDGLVLAIAMVASLALLGWLGLRARPGDRLSLEYEVETRADLPIPRALLWLALGLAALLGGSHMLVDGAVAIARMLGVTELVIGLTIVAVGTSLPELAASLAGALKNEHEIAIGNVIGSNMFNVLGVLCLPGLIRPAALEGTVMVRDYPLMLALSAGLFLMAYGLRGPGHIARWQGLVLLGVFCAYQYTLFLEAAPRG